MSMLGKFVWYDLMTPDVEGAKAFYQGVMGWGTQASPGPMPYTMWTVQNEPIGGIMALPADAKAPPHWIGYVSTADIERDTRRVMELGGKVYHPVQAVPDVGRFSIVADPQGAAFALWQPQTPKAQVARNTPGSMTWAELNTTDWESAWKFYSAMFGWKETSRMEMGQGMGTYCMFHGVDDAQDAPSMGGMSNAASFMKAPAHWLYYTNVSGMKPTLSRIQETGGKVMNGPMDIPGNAQIAQCVDPQGAFFAVYAE